MGVVVWYVERIDVLCRPGGDLLSQVLRHSTIGAEEFNGRVRDGIGFRLLARATRPAKHILKQEDLRGLAVPIHRVRSAIAEQLSREAHKKVVSCWGLVRAALWAAMSMVK